MQNKKQNIAPEKISDWYFLEKDPLSGKFIYEGTFFEIIEMENFEEYLENILQSLSLVNESDTDFNLSVRLKK